MQHETSYSRLFAIGILSILVWLPLANAFDAPSSDQQNAGTLSSKSFAHVPSDITIGFGGHLAILPKALSKVATFTTDQLYWFNYSNAVFFQIAEFIFLSNKEIIQQQCFDHPVFDTSDPLFIH